MKLTGQQIREIHDISDGTEVTLNRTKGQDHVDVERVEDGLRVRVHPNGSMTTLQEARDDG